MAQRKTFTLRLDEDLLDKLHYAAEYNARSSNAQIEFLVKRFIEAFEDEHGVILLPYSKT
jgi:hypothetical protein